MDSECSRCKDKLSFTAGERIIFCFTLCDKCNKKYSKKLLKGMKAHINKFLQMKDIGGKA